MFTLSQYFLCDGSTQVPDQPSVVCASGFGTLDQPVIDVDLTTDATVAITTGDLDDPSFVEVSAGEFGRLVGGDTPLPEAPPGFSFVAQPMFVEVADGIVVAASQFYLS